MSFQKTVNFTRPFGVPGEFYLDGPRRVQPAILNSGSAAYNIVGATAFTTSSSSLDSNPTTPIVAAAGGTGIFAGILCEPKRYALYGTGGNALAPTMVLPNAIDASLALMGELVVTLPAAANIGDKVLFDNTTGALSTQAPSSTFTGVVATNTLTVTGFVTGGAPLAVGTLITGTGVTPGTYITALGSGSGGNGTYTVGGAATVASTTMTGSSVAPSGKTFCPETVVFRFLNSAAGLATIKMTN